MKYTVKQESDNRSFGGRSTVHIQRIFHHDDKKTIKGKSEYDEKLFDEKAQETLMKLVKLYKSSIKPLEEAYRFNDISNTAFGDGEFSTVPRVLFIGPWSTGKSSLINYILGIENTSYSLLSGAQPTTNDFAVLTYGKNQKAVDGPVLVMDNTYSSLSKFGQKFLEKLEGIQIPSKILNRVNFIDTPGVIENRKQQERGYPFSDACQWFIDHSDLIILVFDPTKLDAGIELEQLFKRLKQQEAKVRIVLNKADVLTSQELLRVYGSLFWSLAPLINTTEPPRVYVGSFWSKPFRPVSEKFHHLFIEDEIALLQDVNRIACDQVPNKIAFLRNHAVRVRNHALVVDQYLSALNEHHSFFRDVNEVAHSIVYTPDEYKIFHKVLAHSYVSKLDLFPWTAYKDFFSIHPINSFLRLSKYCGLISSCLLDNVNYDISRTLPDLLEEFEAATEHVCLSALFYKKPAT